MKLVLTHGYFLADDSKELEIMRPYPTLGLLYISSYLKADGKDVSIVDSTFLSKEEWKAELVKLQPGLVAFYSNLMTKLNILELNSWLKSTLPNTVTLVGGPDVTYNIEHYLNAGFDYTVSGEGEQTVLELSNAVEQQTSVAEIQGIAYKTADGEIIRNEARTKIKELETLPFPDRGSIPIEKYLDVWKTHHGKRTLNISTQRGCPYTCKWCSTAVYGQSYRRNDPERVVAEILELKDRFGVEALWFVDDVFTVSHKWIADLHAAFQRNNLTIDFECITRAERLNATVLQQLKEMGCFRIWIGAESGSQRIIDRMDRRVSLETVQATMQQTRALGMEA
ncbi:MAG: B12-binding domain-containing radical SAM protein, partial [Flavobacteriia bacterium]|nr:B12-binding domain-containing radical SAM protein [Flavobacteriia bacterium]